MVFSSYLTIIIEISFSSALKSQHTLFILLILVKYSVLQNGIITSINGLNNVVCIEYYIILIYIKFIKNICVYGFIQKNCNICNNCVLIK